MLNKLAKTINLLSTTTTTPQFNGKHWIPAKFNTRKLNTLRKLARLNNKSYEDIPKPRIKKGPSFFCKGTLEERQRLAQRQFILKNLTTMDKQITEFQQRRHKRAVIKKERKTPF